MTEDGERGYDGGWGSAGVTEDGGVGVTEDGGMDMMKEGSGGLIFG